MSNLAPIATTKIAAGQGGNTPQALQGATTGVAAVGAGNFWDIILSQLNFSGEAQAATTTTPAEATKKPVTQNNNPLAMLQVALSSQQVDADGNIVLSADAQKLQGQLDMTNKVLNFIKDMVPDTAEKKGIIENLLSKLQTKSDTLQASIAALESGVLNKDTAVDDIPLPLLIAMGLSPSEITQVTDKIQALEKKLGRDITVEDLIAGVGGLIPPTQVSASTNVIDSIDENTAPSDDLAAKLNAMDVGGEETSADGKKSDGDVDLKAMPIKADGKADVKGDMKAPSFKENLVNLFNDMKSQSGEMLFPLSFFDTEADASAAYQSMGIAGAAASTLSFGSTAQAANLVSSNLSAGQTHPATQMVAANIMKAGKDGVETMTLRLDPPELGNVNVRLQFGKDKLVKAHLVVEKPETYMMLQRDSQDLQRALQSAGLDATADSVTFELAQDNSAFSHNNNGQGGGEKNFGGGASDLQNAGMDGEIVQSSMTWNVDPSTGRIRYNIFV